MAPRDFQKLVDPYAGQIVVDIGTGDGLFVYRSARAKRHKFFIGIDPNLSPLRKISQKIYRKPSKGGAPNALFLQASIEALPSELQEIANEVYIQYPWGRLLQVLTKGEKQALTNLRRICAPGAILNLTIGWNANRDRSELERLQLHAWSMEYLEEALIPQYQDAGFAIASRKTVRIETHNHETSWARRLRKSKDRFVISLVFALR